MKIFDNLRRDNPFHEGRTQNMHHWDLYEALGLDPKKHLPDEGTFPRQVGNVTVWVVPRKHGTNQDAKRTWCVCPHCDKVLTAGKLHQHMKVHPAPADRVF